MKRKKDPVLTEVLSLARTLSPMLADFDYAYDKDTQECRVTFQALSLSNGAAEVEKFDLSLEQARWYLLGAANGSLWLNRVLAASAHRGQA